MRLFKILKAIATWCSLPFVVETTTTSVTVGGNTGSNATASPTKTGYVPVAVVGIQISGDASGYAQIRQWRMNGNIPTVYVWNTNAAQKTWTVAFHVLWRKTLGGGVRPNRIFATLAECCHFREEVLA